MGKTFEALERAEQEFKKGNSNDQPAPAAQETYVPAKAVKRRAPVTTGNLPDLKSKRLTRYAGEAVKTIMVRPPPTAAAPPPPRWRWRRPCPGMPGSGFC